MDLDPDPAATQIMLQILLLAFLTCVNAFFAGAEMAVVSVNRNKIKKLADGGNKNALLIQSISEDSTRFLSTIQVAITFANFFSSASAASGISEMLGVWLSQFNVPGSETVAMVIITLILSFVTLVLGELVPKRIALQNAEKFSLICIRPIYSISIFMSPFVKLLSKSTDIILRLFGFRTDNMEEPVTEEEIKSLLDSGSEQGVIDETEREMIESVFSFGDKIAWDVMVPRKEVFAINIDEPIESYIDRLIESRYSKVPVYKGNIDNIIGVIHMKDFFIEAKNTSMTEVDIRTIMKEPYMIPESKRTDALFSDLKTRKNYIAIVIDEYGGFSGIVTVENLVEAVMGDIHNEFENEDELIQISENTYIADGAMFTDEINERLNLNLEIGNYETLSGYIVENIGYIPNETEKVEIRADGNVILKIEEMASKAISKVRIIIEDPFDNQALE